MERLLPAPDHLTIPEKYDYYYLEGKKVLALYNPCNFKKDEKGVVTCRDGKPCCTNCKHLGPEGCTVDSLMCKLWVCTSIRRDPEMKECVRALEHIDADVRIDRVPRAFRGSKEESLDKLDSY